MNKGKDIKALPKNKTVLKIVSSEKKKTSSLGRENPVSPIGDKSGLGEESTRGEPRANGSSKVAPNESPDGEPKSKALSDVIHKKASGTLKIIGNESRNTRRVSSAKERSTGEFLEDYTTKSPAAPQKKSQSLEKLIAQEGSIGQLLSGNLQGRSVYDLDNMTPDEMKESLSRIKANPIEPFNFLSNVMDEVVVDDHTPVEKTKPTEIDLQLAALVRRVEMNKVLLERTNQRIKDINFLAERNQMVALRDFCYDEECFLRLKEAGDSKSEEVAVPDMTHPGIDELKRTMNVTLEMLGYVHKIASGDLASVKHIGMEKPDGNA